MSGPLLEALPALLLPGFKEQVVLMVYEKWNNPDGSRKVCTHPSGCDQPIQVSGLCGAHYHRERKKRIYGDQSAYSECPVGSCGRRKLKDSKTCGGCRQTYWRYGLSVEDFLEMMLPENRFCGNPGCGSREKLRMDHDHSCCPPGTFDKPTRVSCGKCVRGWLCQSCNITLGQMQEDPRRIQGLLDYLNLHQAATE